MKLTIEQYALLRAMVYRADVEAGGVDINFYLDGDEVFLDTVCFDRSSELTMKRGELAEMPPVMTNTTVNFSSEEV